MNRRFVLLGALLALPVFLGLNVGPHGEASGALCLHYASAQAEDKIADVAERVVQSVVNISSTRVVRTQDSARDPLRHFFFGPRGRPPARRGQSLGSGVVIDGQGLVVTNNHVVAGADAIKVTTSNGRELEAEIVGSDAKTDVAVLRLRGDVSTLKPMKWGDSDVLRLGETVLAVGNPFGLGHTVTMGIVSAKGRANMGITEYENFIQTDAAINPGNSGGALVNTRGELVGINTAIASRSGGYQGIGFAIPSLMAKEIMGSLLEHGSVKRGWLGVSIQALTPNLARQFGLGEESHGVLVSEVLEGTPAEKAGLRSGDVVLALDGEEMRSPAELRNEIAARGAGKRVQLAVQRDGARQSFAVKLGLLPDGDGPVGKRSTSPAKGPLGLELRAVDDSTRSRLGLAPRLKGVLVSAVDPGSAGDLAGLRAGDIIIDANHRRVASVDAFRKAVNRSKREILIRFKRGRGTLFAIVRRAG